MSPGAATGAAAGADGAAGGDKPASDKHDNVVDAEFVDVDDKK